MRFFLFIPPFILLLFCSCGLAEKKENRPELTRSHQVADSIAAQRLLDQVHIDTILKKHQLDSIITDSVVQKLP